MDNQPSIDRTLLLPILIGAFSIFGILIILLIGRVNASRASVSEEPTETPFKYIYLGTEPLPSIEGTISPESELSTETPFGFEGDAETPTPQPAVVRTPTLGTPGTSGAPPDDQTGGPPFDNTSPANTGVPTFNPGSGPPPLSAGTYDNTNSAFVYDGPGWASSTTGGGTCGTTQGTLHVSSQVGSSVTFSFIGKEVRIQYQPGSNLGEVAITIDGQELLMDQSDLGAGNEWVWVSAATSGTHTVLFAHDGGGSVNLDCVIVPAVAPTGTITVTPTRTEEGPPQ
jgi:hypothetical protein